jgi:tRNA pseudouridine32 synthase/23S rRNA pseudouridine746 synthase
MREGRPSFLKKRSKKLLFDSLPVSVPEILFRDSRYLVLNKPAGLPVHAGPGHGASVEDLFPVLSRRRNGPWLAHRLDADTSGCLVIALTKSALVQAQCLFAAGRVEKIYWAIVNGAPALDSGTVVAPLRKQLGHSGWRMVVDDSGQPATSDWRVMGRGAGMSLLEVRPRTGRTHQVRVHCAHLGCPVIGDGVYGPATKAPLMLLARAITLPMEPPLSAIAPAPGHMQAAIKALMPP